jgi:hypothetical protein
MKKLLAVSLLIFCLSFPAFGGHTTQGNVLCECTPIQGACPCCGGTLSTAYDQESENELINQNASDIEPSFELGLVLLAFLMWLKLKA